MSSNLKYIYLFERSEEKWKQIDPEIVAQSIVPGLYMLKVPSLGKFTSALKNLASKTTETKILSISGQSEVQIKVSFTTKTEEDYQLKKTRLSQIYGISEKFDFKLPTVGQNPTSILPHFCSFGVEVTQLLCVLREIEDNPHFDGIHVDQIYDFWG